MKKKVKVERSICPRCGGEGYIYQYPDDDIIEDGFGSSWSAWCPICHSKSMQIVRPGKVQCIYCE